MQHAAPLSPSHAREQRAVEVVTHLGDSIVDVAHIEPARASNARRAGYIFLAAAALLFVVATAAFAKGVHTAAENQRAYSAWLETGRPTYEFRPQRLSQIYDAMAFGGLGLGLAALVLGVICVRVREPRTRLTLGTGRDADICSADAPDQNFTLVDQREGAAVVSIASGMSAELRTQGQRHDLGELAALGVARASATGYDVPLHDRSTLSVAAGALRFTIRSVVMEPSRMGALAARVDERMAKFFGMSAIAHIAVLALFYIMPPEAHSLSLDLENQTLRTTSIRSKANEPPKTEPERDAPDSESGQNPAGSEHVSMNTDDQHRKPDGAPAAPQTRERPRTHAESIRDAQNSGLLVSLRSNSALFDQLTDGSPLLPADLEGQIYVAVAEGGFGPGGGTFGNHVNGPGHHPGTIQSGSYHTVGWPAGPGGPGGPGPGIITTRDHHAQRPIIKIDKPDIIGDLDMSTIRRRIRDKIERIEHCYERELMGNPDLAGTLTTEFMISPQGKVVYARATGMGNQRLESCVADVVATVNFPMPRDSSSVQVKYPFHFRKAG